jgi:hypothetical protein
MSHPFQPLTQPYQGFFLCVKLVVIIVIVFVGLVWISSLPAIIAAIGEAVTRDY